MDKSRTLAIAVTTICLAVLVGCGKSGLEDATVAATVAEAPAASKGAFAGSTREMQAASMSKPEAPVAMPRQIIRHAELGVRVSNVDQAERKVNSIVESVGGYVESAQSSDLDTQKPLLTISLRVPVTRFQTSLVELERLGTRLNKTISSDDVTGEIVDLEARMKTLLAQEDTYRQILRQARRLTDVLEVQQHITQIRSSIESMAAQRKQLAGAAAMSTISLTLTQDSIMTAPAKDPSWASQSWAESTSELTALARSAAIGAIWFVVFTPLWLPVLVLLRRGAQRMRSEVSIS